MIDWKPIKTAPRNRYILMKGGHYADGFSSEVDYDSEAYKQYEESEYKVYPKPIPYPEMGHTHIVFDTNSDNTIDIWEWDTYGPMICRFDWWKGFEAEYAEEDIQWSVAGGSYERTVYSEPTHWAEVSEIDNAFD